MQSPKWQKFSHSLRCILYFTEAFNPHLRACLMQLRTINACHLHAELSRHSCWSPWINANPPKHGSPHLWPLMYTFSPGASLLFRWRQLLWRKFHLHIFNFSFPGRQRWGSPA